MVAPQDPRILAERVRRLEMLFLTLIATLGDDEYDEEMWFDLRRLFRKEKDWPFSDYSVFRILFERIADRRRREQPESVLHQIEQLRHDVQDLSEKTSTVQSEAHALMAIQALGLPDEQVRLTRFVPVRAYIDQTPDGAIGAISSAISEVLGAYGFDVADEFPAILGSWFKKWFAKSKDVLSQPEVVERLEKIERAVELKAIDKPQADVDDKQASAIAKLIKSLDKVPNAAVQAGSVLVVKLTTPKGPVVQARTLTQAEMVELENNQLLLLEPAEVLGKLSAACSDAKRIGSPRPAPQRPNESG